MVLESDVTKVYLPKNLPYPLTILKINVKEGDEITKYSPIITYRYYDYEPIPISEQDEEHPDESERKLVKVENVGTFDSVVDGKIIKLHVSINDEIENETTLVAEILEPCSHPIQYGGLCAVCGNSVEDDEVDKRAPILMAHGTTDLKVSSKEAENIERSSTERLLKAEKLSLVVDLDQTVIHVTVDPTVAEWMSDPTNPNYDAVKDVKSFTLDEPPIIPIGYKGPVLPTIKRWYYVKLRPGLQEFLSKMNERYEMHIYTMATRQYAESIAKIIDPDGIYFGERILSRDESGSLTQKSLKRLFPVDTSMVVVIDDRGDVWNWSPNLIKVVPYDFFLGIGDINSSFLPRQQALLGPSKRRKSVNVLEEQIISDENTNIQEKNKKANENVEDSENNKETTTDKQMVVSHESSSPVDRLIELSDGGDNADLLAVQESERTNVLEQQEHDRPLARLQENLDKIIEEGEEEAAIVSDNEINNSSTEKSNEDFKSIVDSKESHNLLNDDDKELEFLGQALVRIHNEFYFEVEKVNQDSTISLPDVKDIMTDMKRIVFKDCVFLLSGILPLGTQLQNADIVIWAKSFGASFVENYTTQVTHVICKNSGTFKVRLAKSVNHDIKIVNPDWLFVCMSLWDRISEDAYIIKVDNLLSKAQVDDFLQFHGENTSLINNEPLDWGEIDDEMKEFMGSDYDDDDEEEDDEDEDHNDADGGDNDDVTSYIDNGNSDEDKLTHATSEKHLLDSEDDNLEEINMKKKQKVIEHSQEKNNIDTNESNSDNEVDEFERDLLEHLADLE